MASSRRESPLRERWDRGATTVALIGLGAGVVVGCSDSKPDPAPAGSWPERATLLEQCDPTGVLAALDEPVRISLWHPETEVRAEMLTQLVEEFDRAHPTVDVSLEYVNTTEQLMSRWRNAVPDARPSLALLPQQMTQRLADSGHTVAPGRCLAEAIPDAVPSIAATWSIEGVAQAMPFAVSTPVLFYNRRLFTAAGLDPDAPPTDMATMRTASERLVETGVAKYGLVVDDNSGGLTTWMVEQWNAQVGVPTLEPNNGHRSEPTRAAWRDGPAVEAFAWLQGMVDDNLALMIDNYDGLQDLVEAGDPNEPIAMTIHTCASLGELIDFLAGNPAFEHVELDVGPLPGPGSGSLPGGDALWLLDGMTEAETNATWALEMWLTSPAVQARWSAATGYVPVTQAASPLEPLRQKWLDHPEMAVAYDQLVRMGTRPVDLGMQAGPEPEIGRALAVAFQRLIAGEPADEVLIDAADTTDALLAAYDGRATPPIPVPESSPG